MRSPDASAEALASGAACRGVVHLGNLEVDPAESPLSTRAAAASWRSALSTVQVLAQCTDATAAPRLWLVTAGAQVATPGDVAGSISGADTLGVRRGRRPRVSGARSARESISRSPGPRRT